MELPLDLISMHVIPRLPLQDVISFAKAQPRLIQRLEEQGMLQRVYESDIDMCCLNIQVKTDDPLFLERVLREIKRTFQDEILYKRLFFGVLLLKVKCYDIQRFWKGFMKIKQSKVIKQVRMANPMIECPPDKQMTSKLILLCLPDFQTIMMTTPYKDPWSNDNIDTLNSYWTRMIK